MANKKTLSMFFLILLLCFGAELALGQRIVINIPSFTLHLYENGIPQKTYPIAIGTELNPSVLGETAIVNKVVDPTYYPPNAEEKGLAPILPGPENPVGTRWLGLGFSGYGIHGTNNPASIGTAASSGCIRMLNEDVEELADLVKIGTPVHLIYRTVLLQEDPLLHTKTITVYTDIYKQGASDKLLENELSRLGWGDVFWPALEVMLETASGKPNLLPGAFALRLNEALLDATAIRCGKKFYLPCDYGGASQFVGSVQWGEHWFVPLEDYLNETGLRYSLAENEIILKSPKAFLDEMFLGKALVHKGHIYVEYQGAAKVLGTNLQLVPEQLSVIQFMGELYFPAEFISRLKPQSKLCLEYPMTE